MKPGIGGMLRELAGFVIGRILQRVSSGPRKVTDEELREELDVGGPTSDAMDRARRERDERWPSADGEKLREAAGRSMVAEPDADEAPTFGKPWPPRDELN